MNKQPCEYKSPLRVIVQAPSFVTYVDALSNETVGKVYQKGGRWYLSTVYLGNWQPSEVFAKYKGFLTLSKLHQSGQFD